MKLKNVLAALTFTAISNFAFGSITKIYDGVPFAVDQSYSKIYFWQKSKLIEKDVLTNQDRIAACDEVGAIAPKNIETSWLSKNLLLIADNNSRQNFQAWVLDQTNLTCKQVTGAPADFSIGGRFSSRAFTALGADAYLILEKLVPGERSKYLLGKFNLKTAKFTVLVPESSAYLEQIFVHPSEKYLVLNTQLLSPPDHMNYMDSEVWFLVLQNGSLHKFRGEGAGESNDLRYVPSEMTDHALLAGQYIVAQHPNHNDRRYYYTTVDLKNFTLKNRVNTDIHYLRGYDATTNTVWGDGYQESFQKILFVNGSSTSYLDRGYGYDAHLQADGKLAVFRDVGSANFGQFYLNLVDLKTQESSFLTDCGPIEGMLYPAYSGYGGPTYSISKDTSQLAYTYIASFKKSIFVRDVVKGTCSEIALDNEITENRMPNVKFIGASSNKLFIGSRAGVYLGSF